MNTTHQNQILFLFTCLILVLSTSGCAQLKSMFKIKTSTNGSASEPTSEKEAPRTEKKTVKKKQKAVSPEREALNEEGKALVALLKTDYQTSDEELNQAIEAYEKKLNELDEPVNLSSSLKEHLRTAKDLMRYPSKRRTEIRQKAELDKLMAISVMERFPSFKLEDVHHPERVEEAFSRIESDMVVVYQGKPEGQGKYGKRPIYLGVKYWPTPGYDTRSAKEDSEGSQISAFYNYNENFQHGYTDEPVVPVGMPALVWGARSDDVLVMVTADGDVYRIKHFGDRAKGYAETIVQAVPETKEWPKPLRNQALLMDEIWEMQKHKILEPGLGKQLKGLRREAEKCNQDFWDAQQPKYDRIAQKNLRPSTREARYEKLNRKFAKKVRRVCSKRIQAYERAAKKGIEPWLNARRATFEVAKKKLASF